MSGQLNSLLLHLGFGRHDHVDLYLQEMGCELYLAQECELNSCTMVLNAEFHIVPLHAGLDSPGRSAHDAL